MKQAGDSRAFSCGTSMMTEIKLDYDGEPPKDLMERLGFVRRLLSLGRLGPVVVTCTRRGFHVETSCARELDQTAVAAVQAILGSDFRRETFNLARALVLRRAPAFWRTRSNVLYARKL